jgi:hypothetical protein
MSQWYTSVARSAQEKVPSAPSVTASITVVRPETATGQAAPALEGARGAAAPAPQSQGPHPRY